MAYRDPYAEQYARSNQHYTDGPAFDPYGASHQPHQTYDQGGYEHHEPHYGGPGGYHDEPQLQSPEHTSFPPPVPSKSHEDYLNSPIDEKTTKNLRDYRYGNRGALWTKGGRGRCMGRFCCCTILVTLFLIISIVLSLLLWVRPPNITINNVGAPTNGSEIQLTSDGVDINLAVDIAVQNPNYFAVDFKKIEAQIFYPINNTNVGGGTETDIIFHSHSQTNFTFPFTISYKKSLDPSNKILVDIATKCGFIGGSKTQITVDYKISLALKIVFFTISPVVSNRMSFDCPLSQSDIQSLGGSSILGGVTS